MENSYSNNPIKSEKQKALEGELYNPNVPDLIEGRNRASRLCKEFNEIDRSDTEKRNQLMNKLFGKVGINCYITPNFNCDYGDNIFLGDNVYMNFGVVMLDCAKIEIGDNCLIAPNVQFYSATHPIDPVIRKKGLENAKPITIGKNVWIGGCVIILSGVKIGDNSTIGAGSVVTKDIPEDVVAAGNPCRIIRRFEIDENGIVEKKIEDFY